MNESITNDPTRRFSSRVGYYLRYRPRYPLRAAELLESEFEPGRKIVAADIGSGTGFLAELLLDRGHIVYGVEPNREMREAAERLLAPYPEFRSIDGTGEETTLLAESVDLITVAQAFHWLDADRAAGEFRRIAGQDGLVAIIWNNRRIEGEPFSEEYERLVRRYGTDPGYVANRAAAAMERGTMERLFAPGGYREAIFDNSQSFDFEGLRGRLLSSSYAPIEGHPDYEPMMAALRGLFDRYQQQGQVTFNYDTQIFYGRPGKGSP
jgi:SAM-dependent methyltransferase